MDLGKVSVIINCYNGAEFIEHALRSVFEQSYRNFEVVVWDNRSTDDTALKVRQFKDGRIKYYLAKKHTNLYTARNEAVLKASGDFIAFLDCDDFWEPKKLEEQLNLFKDQNVALVHSNFWIQKDENILSRHLGRTRGLYSGGLSTALIENYNIAMSTLMVRKSSIHQELCWFDRRFHIIGDFDFVLRVAGKWRIDVVCKPLATYRIHSQNESKRNRYKEVEELSFWFHENAEKFLLKDESLYRSSMYYLNILRLKVDFRERKWMSFLSKLMQVECRRSLVMYCFRTFQKFFEKDKKQNDF